jgi:glutamate carboxypeptidase
MTRRRIEFVISDFNPLLNHFRQRHDAILRLARALVETESPSQDEAGSRAVVSLLAEAAWELPWPVSVERIDAPGYGQHFRLRAFSDAAQGDGALLLLGHTDTVHPRGTLAARPWREDGGRIYGPGIFDMKANCALALEALRALAVLQMKPRREVVLLLTCDEEIGSPAGRAVVEEEARKAKSCLVLEPSAPGGKVKTGRKGTGLFELHAHGVPAHAGLEPEKGANAVAELARHIEGLHALTDYAKGTTVNLCTMRGGTVSNVIPEHAQAEIDVRFKQMSEAARVEQFIRGLRPRDERVRLEIRGEINRPPLERTAQIAELYEKAKSLAASFNYELGETQVGGGSDGNFVAALGVPVLDGLGVAGDGAHAVHEHILADDIARRGTLLAGLLATL